MDYQLLLSCLLAVVSGVSLYLHSRARKKKQRLALWKFAVGSGGSAAIIAVVWLLAEVLQIVVIVGTIGWLAKQLLLGPGYPQFRVLRKKAS